MGIVYVAALVLGLGTLTLQFVLSHIGADADGDGDVDDLHLDGGADALATEGDLDHDVALGEHGELAHGEAGGGSLVGDAVGVFLSMRFWTFALMAFGLTGSLLHYLRLSGFGLTAALAVAAGLMSGFTAGFIFRILRGGISSASAHDDTIGKMAKVTVPLRKGGLGKVRVEVRGSTVDLLAVTDADTIAPGEEVVVVEHRGEHVYVEPIGKAGSRPRD